MSTIELEAQKAYLAREILSIDDETMINNMLLFFKGCHYPEIKQEQTKKREIGFLDGKARIVFKDDFEMTTEELLELQ